MLNAQQPIASRTLTAGNKAIKVTLFKDDTYLRAVAIPVSDEEIEEILDAVQLGASDDRALAFFRVEAKRDMRFSLEYRKADEATKAQMIEDLAGVKLAAAKTRGFGPINLLVDESGQSWLFHETFSKDARYQRELGASASTPALIFTACDETGHVINI